MALFPCQSCGALISEKESYEDTGRVVCGDCHMHGGKPRSTAVEAAPAFGGGQSGLWWGVGLIGAGVALSAVSISGTGGGGRLFYGLIVVGVLQVIRSVSMR